MNTKSLKYPLVTALLLLPGIVGAQNADSLALQRLRNENFRLKMQIRDLQSRLDRYEKQSSRISSLDDPLAGLSDDSYKEDTFSVLDNWDDLTTAAEQTAAIGDAPRVSLEGVKGILEVPHDDIVDKYVDIYTLKKRNSMLHIFSRYDKLEKTICETFERYRVPVEFAPLCIVESAVNTRAVSKAGAAGLWQLMPDTARRYGLKVTLLYDERVDESYSTMAAARYLHDLHERFGDWGLAIMAYNCGEGTMEKAIAACRGDRSYEAVYEKVPRETREYLPALVAAIYVNSNRNIVYEN